MLVVSAVQALFRHAYYVPFVLAAVYATILGLMLVTELQREFIFLHRVVYPFFPRYDNPAYYGIAPYKGRNIKLETPDGEVLGAWHILPHSVYVKQRPFPPRGRIDAEVFDDAFAKRPTVLYFHGNAATRASPHRIRTYMHCSISLDCNVVAIDYRGFADSTGTPSQEGLIIDARTAWNWVAEKIAKRSDTPADKQIIILAHSLGTGAATALTAELADAGFQPRALVMLAPFTSIPNLLSSFYLFGFIPLLTPLKLFPAAQRYFKSHVTFKFNSVQALARTHCPILILHALDDRIIPNSQSKEVFEALVGPLGTQSEDDISTVKYEGWGIIRQAKRDKEPVVWWEGEYGDHEGIGHSEGSMDLIAYVAGL